MKEINEEYYIHPGILIWTNNYSITLSSYTEREHIIKNPSAFHFKREKVD